MLLNVSPGQFEESTYYPDENIIWEFYLIPLMNKINLSKKNEK